MEEHELYRKMLIGYYCGGIAGQITGTFVVTNKKISYNPLPIPIGHKAFTIDMNDIVRVERKSVLGINLCICVYTNSLKKDSYTFSLGIQNAKDIDKVVDLINNHKRQ